MRWSSWNVLLLTFATVVLLASAPESAASCQLSQDDRQWLDRSIRSWNITRRHILRVARPQALEAQIFDRRCLLTSRTAMTGRAPDWVAREIVGGSVTVGGQSIPVGIFSAAIGDGTTTRFVMSTPSVWRAGRVQAGALGLERLMTAVMIHEATHVFQKRSYGARLDAIQRANRLSDDKFSDDAIQKRFEDDTDFASSIRREIDLFFAAATADDTGDVHRLAKEARALMTARMDRFYVGDQAYQRTAEDLWLTMEGSAQWAAYRWLQRPASLGGGGVTDRAMLDAFSHRGRWWTQLQGIAIALTLDRLDGGRWRGDVFGPGQRTLLETLDAALDRVLSEQLHSVRR